MHMDAEVMNGHERRLERNAERIVQAALELFQTHGVRKAAISDVAQKAGVTPATVYNHFGSKDGLILAVVRHFLTGTAADIRRIMEADLPYREKIQQIFLYKSDMMGRYQGDLLRTIVSEDPGIRQLVESVYQADILPYMIAFWDEGKKQGYINPDLATGTIIRYAEMVRSGMTAESSLSDDPEYNRKWLEEMAPIFLYGIAGRPE
jgi:AcrR family transcriptional regulator